MVAMALSDLASLEAQVGHLDTALRLQGAAIRETERVGGKAPEELTRVADPRSLALAGGYDPATVDRLTLEGRVLSDEDVVRLAEQR